MKKLTILILAICFLSCKSSLSQRKANPEAVKLNNQALDLVMHSGGQENDQIFEKAVALLNQAIKIDSNYSTAYLNKFTDQNKLKKYGDAIVTGKRLIALKPNDVNIKLMVGEDFEKLGDTIASVKYYNDALSGYNKILDTMNVNNKAYSSFLSSTAIDLILLNRQKEGYAILKTMAEKETDPYLKQMYEQYLKMSRNDWLFWNIKKNIAYSNPVKKTQ